MARNSEFTYIEGLTRTLGQEEIHASLLETRTGFETMIEYPPGGSRVYPAMAQAVIERIDNPADHPAFAMVMRSFMQDRPDLRGDHKAHLMRNALQHLLINDPNAYYPADGDRVTQWHMWMDSIQSSDYRLGELEELLATRFNQATDPNRYAGPHLGLVAHASKHPSHIDLADIGCSAGFGNIQLGNNLGFQRTEFNASPGEQTLLSAALRKQLSIRKNIGMDRVLEADWPWVGSCSIYDYEVYDQDRISRLERMHAAKQKNRTIDIVAGDITLGDREGGVGDLRAAAVGGQVDAVLGITSFYEISRRKLPGAIRTAQSLGRVSLQLQDAIVQHSDGKIEIVDEIYKVPYSLFYMDLTVAQPKRRFIKLGEWESFRCRLFTPTEYLVERLYEESQSDASVGSRMV